MLRMGCECLGVAFAIFCVLKLKDGMSCKENTMSGNHRNSILYCKNYVQYHVYLSFVYQFICQNEIFVNFFIFVSRTSILS